MAMTSVRSNTLKLFYALTVLLSLSCSRQSGSSSAAAAYDDSLDDKNFEESCDAIANGGVYTGEQRTVAVRTVTALWTRYRARYPERTWALPTRQDCFEMFGAWRGRRLDLSWTGRISLLLVAKLNGVLELDVSGDRIDDRDMLYLNNANTVQHSKIYETLASLDASHNEITGELPGLLDFSTRFLHLQQLDLSNNKLTAAKVVKPPKSIVYVSLARNPDLNVDALKSDSFDTAWESATSLISLDFSGIKSLDLSALYLDGPRNVSVLDLSQVGSLTVGTKRCTNSYFPNLLYVSVRGSNASQDAEREFLDGSKACFPQARVADSAGSSLPTDEMAARYPLPVLAPKSTCDGELGAEFTELGRVYALRCAGRLTAEAFGFSDAENVSGQFGSAVLVFHK
jgi:hypothetical protein